MWGCGSCKSFVKANTPPPVSTIPRGRRPGAARPAAAGRQPGAPCGPCGPCGRQIRTGSKPAKRPAGRRRQRPATAPCTGQRSGRQRAARCHCAESVMRMVLIRHYLELTRYCAAACLAGNRSHASGHIWPVVH